MKKPLFSLFLLVCLCFPSCEAPPTRYTVYLDAGHGGFDPGAVCLVGEKEVCEKDVVLSLALRLYARLTERGYPVILSREGEERLTYTTSSDEAVARREEARRNGAALAISLHLNAYAGEGRAFGARVYYSPDASGGRERARIFGKALSSLPSRYLGKAAQITADGGYIFLKDATLPALLLEAGFLSDEEAGVLLCTPAYQDALALSLCEAVDECRKNGI